MKLSELLKSLYEESEFTSVRSLSDCTEIDKGFIDRAFAGKNTVEKLDILFEELTSDLDIEEFMLAIKLIRIIKSREIKNQML